MANFSTSSNDAGYAVSIITATYNRSYVLRYAIRSVIAQRWSDWELIVVGDACTDDTAEVVASFKDSRIRFVNLARNVGEQSGPNNEGCRLARGRYIAFLNHDDMWLPHYLDTALEHLERRDADLVFTLVCIVGPTGGYRLDYVALDGQFHRWLSAPASAWVFRRALLDEIGPWRSYRDSYLVPSQDWLQRAHRAGKTLLFVPRLGVFAIHSGSRPGSYVTREDREHRVLYDALESDPAFVEKVLAKAAIGHAWGDPANGSGLHVLMYLRRALVNLGKQIAVAAGMNPAKLRSVVTYRRKGAFIDQLRRIRGLPPIPRN